VSVHVLGPPRDRRRRRGAVPGPAEAEPGDVGLHARGPGVPAAVTDSAWLIRPEGLVPYGAAFDAMHELAERRVAGRVPDVLILLEHPPVYTAGRRSDPTHLRWTESQIEAAGAEL